MNERLYRTGFAVAILMMSVLAVHGQISISHLSTYATGSYNTAAAEIVSFDPVSEQIFFVNAQLNQVVALDASDPASLTLAFTVSMASYGGVANSVTVVPGGIAVAAEASPKTSPGKVVFFDASGTFISEVTVGAQPDMVTVTPNGQKVLVANEGEPNDTYTIDPQGTVSVIDISGGLLTPTVSTIDFTAYTPAMLPGVRIFGPGATVAQDLEPEYIAVSDDGLKAFVVFQENNAMARIDVATNTIEQLTSLGLKDHSLTGNGLDASDNPANINIANWPVKGMYMPDAIDAFTVAGQTYVAYANEGDAREWGTFVEPRRIGNAAYVLDPTVFPNAATLKQNANLGRLNASIHSGDTDNDGDFDEIHVLGSRSFTIRDANGAIVWDSGDQLEQITAAAYPTTFNSNNSANNSFDSRSDDKGPEPEAITIAEVYGSTYAFIGLERIGGVMVYDVSAPSAPVFIQYINNRDFTGNAAAGTALDLGPEDVKFVSAANSPDGMPFLIVGNEISGTVSLFRINPPPPPPCTLNEVTLTLTTDNDGAQTSWEILPAGGGTAVCSGDSYASNSTITATCCLANGCYNLRVYDSFGDGMSNGPVGGWILRDANNERILDNAADGFFSGASVQAPDAFCLPIGTDRLTTATCDQEAVTSSFTLQAQENAIVTGQYGITNALSGYQFWIYNPDGSYSRRVFQSHQAPGTSAPSGTLSALRATYLRLNTIVSNPVPSQQLLNVRVRARIAGANQEYGPACRMKIDPTVNCQTTQLTTTADPVISCGATGLLLNGLDAIHATLVPGANRYQFRFTRPGYTRNIATNSRSLTLFEFTTKPLQPGLCYDVVVRASFDNGATWCAFGASCEVCIGAPAPLTQRAADATATGSVMLWPNPNNGDRLNITMSDATITAGNAQVDVFDAYGKKVLGRAIPISGSTLNTSIELNGALASGLYLVTISTSERTFTDRVIIQP